MSEFAAGLPFDPDIPLPNSEAGMPMTVEGALREADRAALQARRLLDASRSLLTGNIAMGCCLPPLMMITVRFLRNDRDFWLWMMVVPMFLGWVVASTWVLVRHRSAGEVKVVDGLALEVRQLKERPSRFPGFAIRLPGFIVPASVGLVVGSWLLRYKVGLYVVWHLKQWLPAPINSIVFFSSFILLVVILIGLFIGRFVVYRFWEDILFAASIALAWVLPALLPRGDGLAVLAAIPVLAVIVGTTSLNRRWRLWFRTQVNAPEAIS